MIRFMLLCAAALPAQAEVACAWSNPGHNPFVGNHATAILAEPSVPAEIRVLLVARRIGRPDDRLEIWRDTVTGRDQRYRYSEVVRGMRFGKSARCETLDRTAWGPLRSEPASAWCVASYCYVVPDVCGNPSFVRRYVKTVAGVPTPLPEPSALVLVLGALAGLFVATRRRA